MNAAASTPGLAGPSFLIAEDDLDDQMLIRDAFIENGIPVNDIEFVNDGQELLDLLNNKPVLPRVVLLDLNMPKKDGREALKEIKAAVKYKHIPVIVFTTSSSVDDIRLTYEYGGNSFFTKPSNFNELVSVLALLKKYWLEKVQLMPV